MITMAGSLYPLPTKCVSEAQTEESSRCSVVTRRQLDSNFYNGPSIRHIQRNIVKSRTELFEKKDNETPCESVSPKPFMLKNSPCLRFEAGVVRPAKSMGNLDSVGLSRGSFSPCFGEADCRYGRQVSMSPERSVFVGVSGNKAIVSPTVNTNSSSQFNNSPQLRKVVADRHLPATDIVAQRRSVFEPGLKPVPPDVASFKPTIRPKPSLLTVGNTHAVLCRSKSSDSDVSANDHNSQSCLEYSSSQPAVRQPNYLVKRPNSPVKRPNSPLKRPNSPSVSHLAVAAVNRFTSPDKLSAKPSVVGPSGTRPLPLTPTSVNKPAMTPTPPPKPPRALTVSQSSPLSSPRNTCPPPSSETYGLLVYAASPPQHSSSVVPVQVHVEELEEHGSSSDTGFSSQTSIASSRMQPSPSSQLSSNSNGPSTLKHNSGSIKRSNVKEVVLLPGNKEPILIASQPTSKDCTVNRSTTTDSTSRMANWDQKFIRAPKDVISVHNKVGKDHFVKKKCMNNPCYMYVSMQADDMIRSKPTMVMETRPLTRHHSDDMLNLPASPNHRVLSPSLSSHGEPQLSLGPHMSAGSSLSSDVCFDAAGYAVPCVVKNQPPELPPKSTLYSKQDISMAERRTIQNKVSNAYSILRLNFETESSSIAGSTDDRDSDADIDLEEHKRRLRHVSRVKEATGKDVSNYEKVRLKGDQRLFEFALLVSLEPDDSGVGYKPHIAFCFPPEVSDIDKLASHFCFPEADEWQPVVSYPGETFSFLLTNAVGGRKYGWCCRYLPPGEGPRLPEAVCIVSQIGELNLYNQLLSKVKECRLMSLSSAEDMLQVAYARPFPAPNNEVYIRTVGPNFQKMMFIIKREAESRYNNVNFSGLLSHLPVDTLLQVFASILLERRVILCSNQLGTLSSCMSTIVALLFPFEWQHTFITVLPSMLIDVVDAPTPYIIGILSSMKPLLDDHHLSEVLIVNLDDHSLLLKLGDESRIIPKRIQKALYAAINDDSDVTSPQCINNSSGFHATDETIAEAFLRMFVETCGHYDNYITVQQNGEKIFQRELFVKVVSSRSIRMFLEWFTLTQMFEVFITDKLKVDCVPGLFEDRVAEYRVEMDRMATTFRDNVKVFRKKFVGFFRDYGERIKKTFQKGVYV